MHEAVDALLKLHERAKRDQADNLASHDRSRLVLRSGLGPGVAFELLAAQ